MALVRRTNTQQNTPTLIQEVYSDFNSNLEVHPVKKDFLRHVNENSVKRAIKNILLTKRGDRFFNPDYGSDIYTLLFEPLTDATQRVLEDLVKTAIKNYEPRARLINVTVTAGPDDNTVYVTVVFGIINNSEPITLQVTLDRIR